MERWWSVRLVAWGSAMVALALALALTIGATTTLRAQAASEADALNDQVVQLHKAGKYDEALPIADRVLAIREKALGPDHLLVAISLNNLAELYRALGRYGAAAPLHKRALAIREKALGPGHSDVAESLNNLAALYADQGRHGDAEPLYRRALAIDEKALGPHHPAVAADLNNLAELYRAQARTGDAEPLHKRALAIREKALGPDHSDVAMSLHNLASLYRTQGRYGEAEPLYQRALAIREKTQAPDHPEVAATLDSLAGLYDRQGRFGDAEPLYKRALAIEEKAFGPDHPRIATTLQNLALLYDRQGRGGEAESLYRRALSIQEKKLGPDHPHVATSLDNLAGLYVSQGRYSDAEPLHNRALAIREKTLGPTHPAVATSLNNLARLFAHQGRYAGAAQLYERVSAILEMALGPDHPDLAMSLNNLAMLSFAQRDWVQAVDNWRRSTAIAIRRERRGAGSSAGAQTSKGESEAEQVRYQFWGLVSAAYRLAPDDRDPKLAAEMFETAQWAQSSEAAASLAEMAARSAKGDAALAAVVRERQDLAVEWQKRDAARTAAVSQAPDQRDKAAEAANAERLVAIDAAMVRIDKRLNAEFSDYAAFASPEPLTVEQAQADLHPDEALVSLFDTPEETFVWVVTKTGSRWVRSELGSDALTREVAALRCGLDGSSWTGDGEANCQKLVGVSFTAADAAKSKPLPFDLGKSHALYKALFGQVEDLIKDKHLLVVPSAALTELPFQVFVTAPPDSVDYRKAAWLARDHALTVLPAVSSLKALRRTSKPGATALPMIGFGNPLLDGHQSDPIYRDADRQRAALARSKQTCPKTLDEPVASLPDLRGGVAPIDTRGRLADPAHLKAQSPLPETADELCAVARALNADVADMRLGDRATEGEVKRLSASGLLARSSIVHFATHGALAGELKGASAPGLILSPPAEATEEDDGYLSASEIAALKLDADWVILSACNTAGPARGKRDGDGAGADGAEALSGLARAFIYAGAHALLVSHWAVNSDATVKLITSAVDAMSRDKTVGRAEALRRAMLAMIDKGDPERAHPSNWAPFVVVGEGAAAR